MTQYDLSGEMLAFHDQHVRLNDEAVKRLREVRDLNLDRIRLGLDDLEKPRFKDWRNQGGFAMETVVNDPAGESNHDLDAALIFDKEDLPAAALTARQRVRDALLKRASNFLQDPEARTNAVTVWYADGYHLDFAIYRRSKDEIGNYTFEHASTEWISRDPDEVTAWFNKTVEDKSPKADFLGNAPKVRLHQLRRITRLVKWFCRSRPSWNLPGGMIGSTLVDECYRPDRDRDDVALYNTLTALKARLEGGCRVNHPRGDGRELTGKTQYLSQVELLKDKLSENLPKLAKLFEPSCTREQARHAWDWIFNHEFWADKEIIEEAVVLAKADTGAHGYSVTMACQLTTKNGRALGVYKGQVLPKEVGLEFSVVATNVPLPYDVRFEAQNTGDEARQARELSWARTVSGYDPRWTTSTAYKGPHRMTCNIVKNGLTLASTSMVIKIAAGLWRGRAR
ncbi:MAG: nucleotide-binding domain-containing protein [Caulobacteraceae bacterium]